MNIKTLLKEAGMTQKELAEKIGMSEIGLSFAINEKTNTPLGTLRKIADAIGVSVADLFWDENPSLKCPVCGAKLRLVVDDRGEKKEEKE